MTFYVKKRIITQYSWNVIQQYSLHGQLIRSYDTYDVYNSGGGGVKLSYPLLSSGSCVTNLTITAASSSPATLIVASMFSNQTTAVFTRCLLMVLASRQRAPAEMM